MQNRYRSHKETEEVVLCIKISSIPELDYFSGLQPIISNLKGLWRGRDMGLYISRAPLRYVLDRISIQRSQNFNQLKEKGSRANLQKIGADRLKGG